MVKKKGSQLLWRELCLYCTVVEKSALIPMCKQWFPSPLATSGHRETVSALSKALGYKARGSCQGLLGSTRNTQNARCSSHLGVPGTGLEAHGRWRWPPQALSWSLFHGHRLGQISGEVNLKREKVAAQDPIELSNVPCHKAHYQGTWRQGDGCSSSLRPWPGSWRPASWKWFLIPEMSLNSMMFSSFNKHLVCTWLLPCCGNVLTLLKGSDSCY